MPFGQMRVVDGEMVVEGIVVEGTVVEGIVVDCGTVVVENGEGEGGAAGGRPGAQATRPRAVRRRRGGERRGGLSARGGWRRCPDSGSRGHRARRRTDNARGCGDTAGSAGTTHLGKRGKRRETGGEQERKTQRKQHGKSPL